MNITITIHERINGDVEVHIKEVAGYATPRESRYADEISASIKEHIKEVIPVIVKRVLASEKQ